MSHERGVSPPPPATTTRSQSRRGRIVLQPSREVVGLANGSSLSYPHLAADAADAALVLRVANGGAATGTVEARAGAAVLGACDVAPTGAWDAYVDVACGDLVSGLAASGEVRWERRRRRGGPPLSARAVRSLVPVKKRRRAREVATVSRNEIPRTHRTRSGPARG